MIVDSSGSPMRRRIGFNQPIEPVREKQQLPIESTVAVGFYLPIKEEDDDAAD